MSGAKGSQKPAFLGPHDGRELELMLEGRKHLSYFFFEVGARQTFPEDQFDLYVANGFLIKDECVEEFVSPETGELTRARNILYATASEAWRIPAMRIIQDIYRRMRPDLERVVGALLGYDSRDVESFIERLVKYN
jgi:hypothetical protein